MTGRQPRDRHVTPGARRRCRANGLGVRRAVVSGARRPSRARRGRASGRSSAASPPASPGSPRAPSRRSTGRRQAPAPRLTLRRAPSCMPSTASTSWNDAARIATKAASPPIPAIASQCWGLPRRYVKSTTATSTMPPATAARTNQACTIRRSPYQPYSRALRSTSRSKSPWRSSLLVDRERDQRRGAAEPEPREASRPPASALREQPRAEAECRGEQVCGHDRPAPEARVVRLEVDPEQKARPLGWRRRPA